MMLHLGLGLGLRRRARVLLDFLQSRVLLLVRYLGPRNMQLLTSDTPLQKMIQRSEGEYVGAAHPEVGRQVADGELLSVLLHFKDRRTLENLTIYLDR